MNNFALSQQDIAEILRRSSSAMKVAGNTIEESIALSVGSQEIVQNASVVGNSLKTVSMRLRGVSDEGEDLSDLVPTLEKKFASVGITLKKTDDEFLSTYEIMKQLREVWDDITDMQRADLLEAVAGKRQAQTISALIENFESVENSLKTMENSAGSAERELARAMDSIGFKSNVLKETLFKMWQDGINREAIKFLVDSLTVGAEALGKFVKVFGLLPPVVSAVAVAMILYNKELRVALVNNTLLATSKGMLISSFKSLGVSITAVTIRAALMWTTLTLGLSLIPTLIGWTASLINTHAKFIQSIDTKIEKAKEEIRTMQEEEKSISSLSDEYNKLLLTENLSIEQKRRLAELNKEIQKTYPDLITSIDTEGNLQYITAEAIEKVNEKRRESIRLKQEEIAQEEKNKAKSIAKDTTKQIKDAVSLAGYVSRVGKAISGDISWKELFTMSDIADKSFNEIIDSLGRFQEATINAEKDISGFAESTSRAIADKFLAKHEDALKKGKMSLDEFAKEWEKTVKALNSPAVQKALKSYEDALKSGDTNAITKAYDKLDKQLKKTSGGLTNAKDTVGELNNTTSTAYTKIKSLEEAMEGLSKAFNDGSKDVEELNKAIKDLEEGKSLDAKTTTDLMLKYPELHKLIKETADGYTVETSVLDKLRKARIDSMREALLAQADITKDSTNALKERLKLMGIELEGIKTVDDARRAAAGITSTGSWITSTLGGGAEAYEKEKKQRDDLAKSIFNYQEANAFVDSLIAKVGNTSVSSASKSAKAFEGLLDVFYKLQRAIDNVNSALARNRAEYERASPERRAQLIAEENSLLREQQQNYANLAKEARKLADQQVAQIRSKGVSVDYDRETGFFSIDEKQVNALGSATREFVMKMIDDLEKSTGKVNELRTGWWELEQQIKGVRDSLKPFDRDLASLRFRLDMLDDTDFDSKLSIINEMMTINADKISKAESELTAFINASDEATRGTEAYQEEIDRLNDIIRSAKLEQKSWSDEIVNTTQAMADNKLKIISDVEKKIRDIIKKSADEEKKRLDDNLKNYRDYVNEKIKALDDEWSEEDYRRELAKQQEKILELQRKKDILALDDSFEARARVGEIDKQLVEENEKLEDMQRKRSREAQKNNLQEQIKAQEKFTEDKKDELEKEFSDEKIIIKARQVMEAKSFEALGKYSELVSRLLGTVNQDIKTVYETFEDRFGEGLSILGDSIKENFVDLINEGLDALKNLPELLEQNKTNKQSTTTTKTDTTPSVSPKLPSIATADTTKQQSFRSYTQGLGYSVDWKDGKVFADGKHVNMEKYGLQNINGTYMGTEKQILEALKGANIGQFAREGYTGSWSGGHGRLAMVHPEEFILNKDTVSNMLQGNLSKILPQSGMQNISNHGGNIEFKFDNLIKVEGNVTKDTLPKLETLINQAGDKLMEKLNNARNKRGMGRDLRFNN